MIANWLVNKGYAVIPLYAPGDDEAGWQGLSAPSLLFGQSQCLVARAIPDLAVWNNKREFNFVEVKRKNRWTRWEGRVETGFNYGLFKQYCEVSDKTGEDIWVMWIHQNQAPTGLFAQELSVLRGANSGFRYWDGVVKNRGGKASSPTAFWPIEKLRRLGHPLEIFDLKREAG